MIIMLVIKMTKDDGNDDDDDDLSCHMTASQLVREPPSPGNQPLMIVMITMMIMMMVMTMMITCSGEADLGGSIGALLLGRVGRS